MADTLTADPYKTLGLTNDASQQAIKQAYRKLALKHHPDKAQDKAAPAEEFHKISQAYELLNDEQKRAKYDESLRAASRKPSGPEVRSKGARPSAGGYGSFTTETRTAGYDFPNTYGQAPPHASRGSSRVYEERKPPGKTSYSYEPEPSRRQEDDFRDEYRASSRKHPEYEASRRRPPPSSSRPEYKPSQKSRSDNKRRQDQAKSRARADKFAASVESATSDSDTGAEFTPPKRATSQSARLREIDAELERKYQEAAAAAAAVSHDESSGPEDMAHAKFKQQEAQLRNYIKRTNAEGLASPSTRSQPTFAKESDEVEVENKSRTRPARRPSFSKENDEVDVEVKNKPPRARRSSFTKENNEVEVEVKPKSRPGRSSAAAAATTAAKESDDIEVEVKNKTGRPRRNSSRNAKESVTPSRRDSRAHQSREADVRPVATPDSSRRSSRPVPPPLTTAYSSPTNIKSPQSGDSRRSHTVDDYPSRPHQTPRMQRSTTMPPETSSPSSPRPSPSGRQSEGRTFGQTRRGPENSFEDVRTTTPHTPQAGSHLREHFEARHNSDSGYSTSSPSEETFSQTPHEYNDAPTSPTTRSSKQTFSFPFRTDRDASRSGPENSPEMPSSGRFSPGGTSKSPHPPTPFRDPFSNETGAARASATMRRATPSPSRLRDQERERDRAHGSSHGHGRKGSAPLPTPSSERERYRDSGNESSGRERERTAGPPPSRSQQHAHNVSSPSPATSSRRPSLSTRQPPTSAARSPPVKQTSAPIFVSTSGLSAKEALGINGINTNVADKSRLFGEQVPLSSSPPGVNTTPISSSAHLPRRDSGPNAYSGGSGGDSPTRPIGRRSSETVDKFMTDSERENRDVPAHSPYGADNQSTATSPAPPPLSSQRRSSASGGTAEKSSRKTRESHGKSTSARDGGRDPRDPRDRVVLEEQRQKSRRS